MQLSACQRARLVDREREARLQQMRDRLAAETDEERQARLQQMRDRLAAETDEERQARCNIKCCFDLAALCSAFISLGTH